MSIFEQLTGGRRSHLRVQPELPDSLDYAEPVIRDVESGRLPTAPTRVNVVYITYLESLLALDRGS
jgi:hypothetical protein